jgi:long-subunit acyl-CoA synthetase (AMP-forming)
LCCVSGPNQPSPFVLILLSEELRPKMHEPSVQKEINKEIAYVLKGVNEKLDPHERLLFAVIAEGEWSTDNSFLTPTLKIKRPVIEAHYESKIEAWYESGEKIIWE